MQNTIDSLNQRVAAAHDDIIAFLRDIVAIPSMNNDIEAVGQRIGEEMRKLGFDQVYVDRYGSIVGRIGSGPTILLYDSHIDTVGIGDRAQWPWDPFEGKIEDGMFYARGALDEKGSTPGMIYGMAMARDLGLLEGYTVYYLGNIEEWCDGVGCAAFVEWEGIRPDFVVIGEPTKMNVYRGHKGRLELEVVCKGRSAHAASNFLGDNAVPDECRIFIDRRVTFGDTVESVIGEIEAILPAHQRADFRIEQLVWTEPSHTGEVFRYEKYFPAWALEENDPFVLAGQATMEALWGRRVPAGKWDFSTNGNYWRGKAGIPSIGFGPGDEIYAHAVNEHVPLADVVEATKFYALLPAMMRNE